MGEGVEFHPIEVTLVPRFGTVIIPDCPGLSTTKTQKLASSVVSLETTES